MNYENAGTVGRAYTPYDNVPSAMGAPKEAFDLRRPGVVREIKAALIALARDRADKLSKKWPDPSIDELWRQMVTDDVWNGPTADQFAIAVSRLRQWVPGIKGPYVQETAVGPQPRGAALEMIAGGVHVLLGGQPAMPLYMAWRDGYFAPPSEVSGPSPSASITPTGNFGPTFLALPDDTTGANVDDLNGIKALGDSMAHLWGQALVAKQESVRAFLMTALSVQRTVRDAKIRDVRTQLLENDCRIKGHNWIPETAQCVAPKPPPPTPEPEKEKSSVGVWLGVGVASAVGYWIYTGGGPGKKPKRSSKSLDWTMG